MSSNTSNVASARHFTGDLELIASMNAGKYVLTKAEQIVDITNEQKINFKPNLKQLCYSFDS